MTVFINATECIKKLAENNIKIGKGYFSQLKKNGKIPHKYNPSSKRKIYIYDEVFSALKDMKDPTRDPQREANRRARENDDLFDDKNIPEESLATMNEEERKKYTADMASKYKKLESMSNEEENATRPTESSGAAEWNTFKIKQQGLNYEIDRKVKERSLMSLSEFKAVLEVVLSPLNHGLDNLAFELKAKFPDVSDEIIHWVLERTNQFKIDVQNVPV